LEDWEAVREGNLLRLWKAKLDGLVDGIFESEDKGRYKWRASLKAGRLVWEDYNDDELRSAEYYGHVWSPYAIPNAIHLRQRYSRRPRYSTMEFSVVWGYKLLYFDESDESEDEDEEDEKFKTICSNCYEDEKLRADVIDVSNLNQRTVHRLRRCLFGTGSQSKQVCDDLSFLRLLFGSMGTFDNESLMSGWIGYAWSNHYNNPYYPSLRKNIIEDGDIDEDDDPEISWLEYSMRKTAGALRPIDNYYTAPTIKDAPGYCSPEERGDYDKID
jgi:hypothetical protein